MARRDDGGVGRQEYKGMGALRARLAGRHTGSNCYDDIVGDQLLLYAARLLLLLNTPSLFHSRRGAPLLVVSRRPSSLDVLMTPNLIALTRTFPAGPPQLENIVLNLFRGEFLLLPPSATTSSLRWDHLCLKGPGDDSMGSSFMVFHESSSHVILGYSSPGLAFSREFLDRAFSTTL